MLQTFPKNYLGKLITSNNGRAIHKKFVIFSRADNLGFSYSICVHTHTAISQASDRTAGSDIFAIESVIIAVEFK